MSYSWPSASELNKESWIFQAVCEGASFVVQKIKKNCLGKAADNRACNVGMFREETYFVSMTCSNQQACLWFDARSLKVQQSPLCLFCFFSAWIISLWPFKWSFLSSASGIWISLASLIHPAQEVCSSRHFRMHLLPEIDAILTSIYLEKTFSVLN